MPMKLDTAPEILLRAVMAYFNVGNITTAAYSFLSIGAANLIHSLASDEHKATYLPPMREGRFAGTMALTEPGPKLCTSQPPHAPMSRAVTVLLAKRCISLAATKPSPKT